MSAITKSYLLQEDGSKLYIEVLSPESTFEVDGFLLLDVGIDYSYPIIIDWMLAIDPWDLYTGREEDPVPKEFQIYVLEPEYGDFPFVPAVFGTLVFEAVSFGSVTFIPSGYTGESAKPVCYGTESFKPNGW